MDFSPSDWTLLESHVDYYAGTTSDPKLGEWVYERARDYIEADRLGQMLRSGASEQSYVGVTSERAFVGQRDDGTYLRLSSFGATNHWAEFCREGLRTSRIDLCCTAVCRSDRPDVAYNYRYDARLPGRIGGRPPLRTLISSEDRGDTLYVGGASASRRGRVYDKARESPNAYKLGAWRWEVQSRHDVSNIVASALVGREQFEGWIQTYVGDWFRDRGFAHPIPPVEERWRDTYRRPDTTDEARVDYLKSSIAPMLAKMQPKHTKRELRELLGLQYHPGERE